MERYPMKLEENFEQLKLQMKALGRLQDPEFQILQFEFRELKRGWNTNNWNARLKLNSKVIKLFSDVKVSQEPDNAGSASGETLRREAVTDLSGFVSNFSGKLEINEGTSSEVEALIRKLAMDKPRRFSYQELYSFTSKFSRKIGSGAYGEVYQGEFPGGVKIAVKVLQENDVIEATFMAEVGTMGMTYHRNLVKLYGFCFDERMKALVYEYMENGSLDTVLYEKGTSIDWEKLYSIAIGVARGLSYLHDVKIIHHDVKPANLLLDSYYRPKVTDFGLANLIDENKNHITLSGMRGTPGYIAPEMLIPYARVTPKCDVYSFGMLLFDILRTRSSMKQKQVWFPQQVWEMFKAGKLDQFIKDCGIAKKNRKDANTLAIVALWCAQWSESKRPRMSTVVEMLEGGMSVPVPPNPFVAAAGSLMS